VTSHVDRCDPVGQQRIRKRHAHPARQLGGVAGGWSCKQEGETNEARACGSNGLPADPSAPFFMSLEEVCSQAQTITRAADCCAGLVYLGLRVSF
jgi:hypothetical protein